MIIIAPTAVQKWTEAKAMAETINEITLQRRTDLNDRQMLVNLLLTIEQASEENFETYGANPIFDEVAGGNVRFAMIKTFYGEKIHDMIFFAKDETKRNKVLIDALSSIQSFVDGLPKTDIEKAHEILSKLYEARRRTT
jgi:hypothetical protein